MRYFPALLAAAVLSLSGCGPLASVACDRVGSLCGNIDLAACDSQMDLAPPHVKSEILDCTASARTCDEAVRCFTSRGYYLPSYSPYRF